MTHHHDAQHLTTAAFWEEHWADVRLPYAIDLRSYRWHCYDQLLRRILPAGSANLLEVGAGLCQWLAYFEHRFGLRTFGLDNAFGVCRVGATNTRLLEVPVRLACADALAAPFAERTFDVVFSDGVIEHFDDPRPILASMARLLRPGGVLVASVPNFAGWAGWARRLVDPEVAHTHRALTAGDLVRALREVGLEQVRVEHFGSFRPPYLPVVHGHGAGRVLGVPGRVALRAIDRALTGVYRATDRSWESALVSAEIMAVAAAPRSST